MNRRRRSLRGRAGALSLASLAVALLVGAFSSTALAAPPVNTAAPAISPSSPEVGKSASTTKGTWNSEAPLHWQNNSGTSFEEGKSITVTPHSNPITFSASLGGVPGSVTCEVNKFSNSSVQNPVGGANGTGAFEIEYTGCTTGGKWTSCTVSFGGKVGSAISLGKLEGNPTLAISPTGADLGTFTLAGEKCFLPGSYALTGVINGFYVSDKSAVEFTAASSGGGALRINKAVVAKATGGFSLENTGTGEAIRLDPLTYEYQWKRCGETCTEIGGATKSSYTPVAEDWGKTLKVTVTATDVNGKTSATSAATSTVQGTPNWYANNSGWQHLTSSPFTSSNVLEGEEPKSYYISFVWGETWFQIGCSGSTGSGTMTNTGTQAMLEKYNLTLTGCAMYTPGECKLTSSEMKFNTMTATSVTGPTPTPSTKLTFKPNSELGEVVSFSLKNCGGLVGPYKFVGSFPGTFVNSGSYVSHPYNEVKSAKTLRFQEGTGPVVTFEGVQRLLSEGHAVKLDAGA